MASHQDIKTGDDAAKRRCFWEQPDSSRWVFLLSTVGTTISFGGLQSVLDWACQGTDMARLQGAVAWEYLGVAVSQMRGIPVALFQGSRFDSNVSALPVKRRE